MNEIWVILIVVGIVGIVCQVLNLIMITIFGSLLEFDNKSPTIANEKPKNDIYKLRQQTSLCDNYVVYSNNTLYEIRHELKAHDAFNQCFTVNKNLLNNETDLDILDKLFMDENDYN